jgi:uncharacterized protein (TIGR02596 family)
MGIIVVLTALVVPAFNSLGRSTNLTVGAQQMIDQLNAARQQAIAVNRQVEVRFYKLPDELGASPAYRALRVNILNSDGTTQSAERVQRFPKGIVILETPSVSTLSGLSASTTNETLPGGESAPYVSFRFRPDGSTDLDAQASSRWFWTLAQATDSPGGNGVPANFATIQLDPVTGRPKLFRP